MNQTIRPRTIDRLVSALLSVKHSGGVISGPEPFLQVEPGCSASQATEDGMLVALHHLKTSRDALRLMLNAVEAGINARQESCFTVALQNGIPSIPDEILAHILEVGYNSCDDQGSGDSGDFSVAVSQVNQRFRRTALRTPQIWTRLGNWMKTSQLETFIHRSKAVDLIITVEIQKDINLEAFFAITVPHHTRWSEFRYDTVEDCFLPSMLSQTRHLALPRLRSLCCRIPSKIFGNSRAVHPEETFATWKMPSLDHFHGTNASIKRRGFGENMKSVELLMNDAIWDAAIFDELGSWPHLTSLNLEFGRFNGAFTSKPSAVMTSLRSLRTLVIKAKEDVRGFFLGRVLSLLDMPVLSNISLEIGRRVEEVDRLVDGMCSAAKRCLSLREFTLDTTHAKRYVGANRINYAILGIFVAELPFLEIVTFRGAGLYEMGRGGLREPLSWRLFHFENPERDDMVHIRSFVTAASRDPKFKLRIGKCCQCEEITTLKQILGDRMDYEAS